MSLPRLFVSVFLLGLVASGAPVAQTPGQLVEVADVNFRSVRAPHSSVDPWYEVNVVVDAKPGAEQIGRVVNRVRVALSLATETLFAAGSRRAYHRSEAEAVALSAGRHHFRFYLPPEIAKRDSLRGAPKEWLVEIAIQGKQLAITVKNHAAALKDPKALASFRDKLLAEATANDGIMCPQYLTPFERSYAADTPTFIRRGG